MSDLETGEWPELDIPDDRCPNCAEQVDDCECGEWNPAGGNLTPKPQSRAGHPAAPGLPPGFWRMYALAFVLSLPVWALIGWLLW